jgi:hypothetical protein
LAAESRVRTRLSLPTYLLRAANAEAVMAISDELPITRQLPALWLEAAWRDEKPPTIEDANRARRIESALLDLGIRELIYGVVRKHGLGTIATFEHELYRQLRDIAARQYIPHIQDDQSLRRAGDPIPDAIDLVMKAASLIHVGPPKWLVDGLTLAVWELGRGVRERSTHRSIPELRSQLKRLARDARYLRRRRISALMGAALGDLCERVDAALAYVPAKQGRAPFYPGLVGSEVDPVENKNFCGLVVHEAWSLCQGKAPGRDNPYAQRACELLWTAAGGPPAESTRADEETIEYQLDAERIAPEKYRWVIRRGPHVIRSSKGSFQTWNLALETGKTEFEPFAHENVVRLENNRRWETYLNLAKTKPSKAAAIRDAFFLRRVKSSERKTLRSDPKRAERLYFNTSPIIPAELIRLWPTRQQAAAAVGVPVEVIDGWASGSGQWDDADIRRLWECTHRDGRIKRIKSRFAPESASDVPAVERRREPVS